MAQIVHNLFEACCNFLIFCMNLLYQVSDHIVPLLQIYILAKHLNHYKNLMARTQKPHEAFQFFIKKMIARKISFRVYFLSCTYLMKISL